MPKNIVLKPHFTATGEKAKPKPKPKEPRK